MSLAICQLPGKQFTRTCSAKVVKCSPAPALASAAAESKTAEKDKGKGKDKGAAAKDEKKNPESASKPLYVVELDQTCLFPEGGGQPFDMGWLTVVNKNGLKVPVVNVQRAPAAEGGNILHFVEEKLDEGDVVEAEVDWVRRDDLMQQHSSQHIISAVFRRDYGFVTAGWSMAKWPEESMIELDTPAITQAQIDDVNAKVNQLIRDSTAVKVHVFASAKEALEDPVYIEAMKAGRAKAFPEGLVGPARCVEIDGLEMNTCCGTHVSSLAELQAIAITRNDKNKGHARIYFNAGNRLVHAAREMYARQGTITKMLGVPPAEHEEAMDRVQTQLRAKIKEADSMTSRLMALQAAALAASADRVVTFHEDMSELKLLQTLASAFTPLPQAKGKVLIATATTVPDAAATASSSTSGGAGGEKVVDGVFMLAGDPALVTACGPIVAKVLNGRGGGRPGIYQGKGTAFQNVAQAVAEAVAHVATLP